MFEFIDQSCVLDEAGDYWFGEGWWLSGRGQSIRIRPLTVKPSSVSWWAASYATMPPNDQPARMWVVSNS